MAGQTFGGASVSDAGGGWWRISLTGTLPEGGASAIVGVLSGGARSFAGDGTSAVLVWGPGLAQGLTARPFALTEGAIAGPQIFNPPAALTQNSRETWAALAGGPNWGGADVYVSLDGGGAYEFVGSTANGPSRFGALTGAYAAGADPDTTDTLAVDLSASASGGDDESGTLTTAAASVADGDGTLSLINDGNPELIAFSTATLADPNRYNLTSYTRRGQLGTPISAHAAGAPFVRLDAAPFVFPFLAPNAGTTVYAKFASTNLWGQSVTPLSNCIAYPFTPAALGAGAPGASAWTAVGGTLSNNGQSIPALIITGASDNPAAQQVVFLYRLTGAGAWSSAGAHPISITSYDITSVAPGSSYDVGVAYIVQGSLGQVQVIATGIVAGTINSGGGGSPGTVIFDSLVNGSFSFTCPAGSYAHVDITITGADGGTFWSSEGPGDFFPRNKGGSGASATLTGQAVTPGTTVIAGSIGSVGSQGGAKAGGTTPGGDGGGTTVTSPAMSVGGGGGATQFAVGAGGAVGSGGTQTAGVAGGASFNGSNGRVTITARA